ncbi:MAG: fucose isomerase [Phycisphaerae bacterium]|nr:fucose isomerase [Phycisphaerae bacterium]
MAKPARRTAVQLASGDLRQSANLACWPAQQALESDARVAFDDLGWTLARSDSCRLDGGQSAHGFISSQKQGRDVFEHIHPEAPLVVAEAAWQYSHHVLIGLQRHRGPILVLANWSGQWPGLVGALNLRGSLTKADVACSLLWGEDFSQPAFRKKLRQWCEKGKIKHDLSHVERLEPKKLPARERALGEALAASLRRRPAIMGVFDEGCMGMFNAIIPDHLLHSAGVFKERLSQSALYYAMTRVPDADAHAVRGWLDARGMAFRTGPNEETDLTDRQILEQCKMYIAACRIAEEFGCDAVGIQYQQGLKDLCPASDLCEGLLNCSDRPPVRGADGAPIREGRPITHFNEVDECAGLDGLITDRVWTAMGLPPDNTLHDLRWGDIDRSGTTDAFVWVFEISGAVPPSHLEGGYSGASSERQPPMYFRLGGGTIKGVSRPGAIVWSRIFVEHDRLHMDLGRGRAISLPREETERRWSATTSQWPIMHAVTYGVSRDQMMARHRANHVQVVYAPDEKSADRALSAKAAMANALGIRVHLCGRAHDGRPLADRLARL